MTAEAAPPVGGRTCILVLGMHRSGTSALTRVLNLMGAALPKNVMGAGPGNEAGHWEPERLVVLHDQMLAEAGSRWDDWRRLDLSVVPPERLTHYKSEIRRLIEEEYGSAPLFVLKDPRICRMVPFFADLLKEQGITPRYALPLRNPLAVIASLVARDGMTVPFAALLWLRHALDAEFATRGAPRVILSYEAMIGAWQPVVDRITEALALDWPRPLADPAPQIAAFLSKDLQHHAPDLEELSARGDIPAWVKEAYAALLALGRDPESPAALATLDDIRPRLEPAAQVFGEAAICELTARERRLVAVRQEHARAAEALRGTLAKRDGEIARLRAEIATRDTMIAELSNEVEARGADIARAEAAHAEVVAALKAEVAEKEREIAGLMAEVGTRDTMIAELSGALDEIGIRKDALETRLSAREQKNEAITGRLTDVERREQQQLEVLGLLQTEHMALKATLHNLEARAETLGEHKAQLVAETKKLAHQLEQSRAEVVSANKVLQEREANLASEVERARWLEANLAERTQELNESRTYAQAVQEAYKNSTSWKVTAPLRRLAAFGSARPRVRSLLRNGLREFGRELITSPNSASGEFINEVAAGRGEVLFSYWHRALVTARTTAAVKEWPNITISVVTWNAQRWLRGFLDSLENQGYPTDRISLVFVDHGSTDSTTELIRQYQRDQGCLYRDVKLFKRNNLGYGSGNDFAIRKSRDEYILVTNVDLEFHSHSIKRVVATAIGDDPSVACWELRQCPYEHPKYYDPVTLETSWSSHACVLLRRSAYLQVGGYEKRIFMYGEDVELSYRLRGAGYRLRYVPAASVTHHVDLHDTTLRSNQLSGSLSANVLLRYRFGAASDIASGEVLLNRLASEERAPERQAAIKAAHEMVRKSRWHFYRRNRPRKDAKFPFSGFDYHLRRDGFDQPHTPAPDCFGKPLVSIITRTYGPKIRYLREAIASVANQTYSNIEHIIVEDRTDFARDIVERTAAVYGSNTRYLKSDGIGRSHAGNYGLAHASGDLLMFLDNDDLLFADHVEVLAQRLAGDPNIVAAYAIGWEVITRETQGNGYEEILHQVPDLHRQPYNPELLKQMNLIPIQCILFRRKLFQRFGGFHEDLEYLEDWNLWVRYSQGGPFEFVPKATSLYRTPFDGNTRERRQALLNAAYREAANKNLSDVERYSQTATMLNSSVG